MSIFIASIASCTIAMLAVWFRYGSDFLRYLKDGRLELSNNNRAERSIKPFVIGRKNLLFANILLRPQTSAVIFSLIETTKKTVFAPSAFWSGFWKALQR